MKKIEIERVRERPDVGAATGGQQAESASSEAGSQQGSVDETGVEQQVESASSEAGSQQGSVAAAGVEQQVPADTGVSVRS